MITALAIVGGIVLTLLAVVVVALVFLAVVLKFGSPN